MTSLDASAVARLLREFGQRTALRGDNPFKAKAYARAADNLLTLSEPLDRIIAQDRLREIPGVGEAIADIIKRLHATGTHPGLERMREEVPEGVLDLLTVPGLRPDKIIKLHRELGVSSLGDLEEAARSGRLAKTKGLGAALATKILQGLDIRRSALGRRHLHRAAELLKSAERHLKAARLGISRVTAAGDFRRGCELVRDLSLVAEVRSLPDGPEQIAASEELTVHLTDRAHAGTTLLLATGSPAHIEGLRALARRKGLTLDTQGLRRGDEIVAAASEEDIYAALGLAPIPPELREGSDEIILAQSGKLPVLVSDDDIRGILHAHTDRSDGVDTLTEMAGATRSKGYEYFGVADHSKSAHYAGGLSIDEIAEQRAEADRLNRRYKGRFRIFKGIESDILPDGSLDYPDEVLASFDFVVASVHSRFKLDRDTQTERIIRAVANPFTTILGHMTGRQLLRRPGYDVDVEKILAACAEHGVAVEINANPWRLDVDWRWHRKALELGCLMSINPDAHSTDEIDLTHWGVEMARKGSVPKSRVLNCLSLDEFTTYLEARSKKSRRRVG
ncbi:MAG: DNA polymerase/3'-5' exonuclease PolX [Hyphomicrobiales bacterium]|nr:DNA polymerase/3'-5' exonuclease PolX [Hyphomicrobiales bacterium]MBV8824773.1 DNA polymerase/3'-5' exonuclease PolX [Hyphomicrobiales bacterium]MBV9428676.1 DNA polymerase/3'-5' exonuclease PolX [Bradyrhizobiaceae bacterium]